MALLHTRHHETKAPPQGDPSAGGPGRTAPWAPYSISQFLDDQSRILEAVEPGAGRRRCSVDRMEGRMIVIRTPHLSRDPAARLAARAAFHEKYGRKAGPALERFVRIQDYLVRCRPRLTHAGLGRVAGQAEVCQEFLAYLLRVDAGPSTRGLPDNVLDRFLDEWGHRWM